MAWMTAYLLKPYDSEGVVTPAALLGKPSGDAAEIEQLTGLTSSPETGYDLVMRKQASRG
jgi:hypothetical protein